MTAGVARTYSRRRLLLTAAATIATSRPLEKLARAAALPDVGFRLPSPHRSGIEHVVWLMMENRSFDHLLGWVPGADGKQAGISYLDRDGRAHNTYPLAPDFQGCGHPDPDHSYEGGRVQFNNGKCDGFLRAGNSDRFAIGYYRQADLPFLGRAARDWTVCDRYFAAVMAETFPNRAYAHAAATEGLSDTGKVLSLPTIWDRLAARHLSGRSYHAHGEPFLGNWGEKYASIIAPHAEFISDCRRGRLPNVAYVDPPRAGSSVGISGDDHPFGDIRAGESFMNQVYAAVTRSPSWPSTVLVITFDEWGGFFDHVPPPEAQDADRGLKLRGFRVPCVVVSPFARRRHVAHMVFDHTSILRMIEWRWGLRPLSVRDRSTNNLAAVLDFSKRRLAAPRYHVPTVAPNRC